MTVLALLRNGRGATVSDVYIGHAHVARVDGTPEFVRAMTLEAVRPTRKPRNVGELKRLLRQKAREIGGCEVSL